MLLSETRGDARFYYEYDANGTLYAVTYIASSSATPVTYYYLHNSRGDIESIYNSNGELIASYKYDSWGKVLSVKDANGNAITDQSHIANLNPFRYRSYYYDTETGLYYLMSRYYDPETGRFINADGYVSTGQGLLETNMFAYCENNPINFADATGTLPDDRLFANARAYKAGGNFITCGYANNNKKSSSKYRASTPSKKTIAVYDKGSTPSDMVRNNSDVVIVYDMRSDANPNMQIENSYRITDKKEMLEILIELNNFEDLYQSDWNRTVDSMLIEWDAHNDIYNMKNNERCQHVDLDNSDEGVTYLAFWGRAIKSVLSGG